jgi:hypothetical protein
VTFGIAQCGLALLLHGRLTRLMRRPVAWAGIALVNLSAMTLFLWHQTAFVAVTSLGLLAGRVPGLLTAPAGALWVAERLAWLPVFAITLSGLWLAFRRVERGHANMLRARQHPRRRRRAGQQLLAARARGSGGRPGGTGDRGNAGSSARTIAAPVADLRRHVAMAFVAPPDAGAVTHRG